MKNLKILKHFFVITIFTLGFFLFPNIVNATPANTAFKDDNFYKCVVDAYNKENNTSVAYTENLTDEQLSSIEKLYCSGFYKQDSEKIENTSGIEKLKNLIKLGLDSNKISEINLKENTKIKYLYLAQNLLENIDLSQNKNLILLDLGEFYNDGVRTFTLESTTSNYVGNRFSNIDLSNMYTCQ